MSDRLIRINEQVREVLAEAVGQLSDSRIGFVTITTVRVARDMRSAKVYCSVLGSEQSQRDTMDALRSAQGLLQRAIAREVKIHHTPVLQFVHDETGDAAIRLTKMIDDETANTKGPTPDDA